MIQTKLRWLRICMACLLCLGLLSATTAQDREAQLAEANQLNQRAFELYGAGRYAEAIPLAERVLAIREKVLGAEHPDVAQSLHNLAGLYQATGDYARALPLYQRSLAILEKVLGPEHPDVALSLNNLAGLYRVTGDYARALPLFQRALAIDEKVSGPEHPDVATTLNNLALLYHAIGDYARALPLFQRALAIWEKVGPEHPDVATTLNNLALLYQATGDYARAAPLFQRALAIWEKISGPEHPDVALSLNNLALLYHAIGDYARALPLFQRALAIWEKVLGPEHPDVALSLNNLALLYHAIGDYAHAAPLHQRALAIWEKVLGPEHPNVATSLNNLALLYQDTGDYARALPLYQRVLAIREKVLRPEHPDVAQSLHNLAGLYQATGDYARALPLFQRALAIWEKVLGPEHPNVALALNNLALLYQITGDYQRAVGFTQRAGNVREKNITALLDTGSQQQKQLYLNTLSGETDTTVSLHTQDAPQNADAARLALTTILRRKGRVLDAFTGQLEALRRRAAPADKKLLDELAALQSLLANLQLGGGNLSPEARRTEVARLTAEQERLEDAIGRRSAEFRTARQSVTLERVQAALPADAALLELFVYQPFNAKAKSITERFGAARYVAYVVRPKDAVPQFVDLGEAAAIDAAAAKFRAALQSFKTPEAQVAVLARNLDERVMRPIRKLLGDTKRAFLSPDGALNLVPFAALVDENGKYLIEDYDFNYLTSGRDLLRLQVVGESQEAPVIVANPLFDKKSAATTQANSQRSIGLLGTGETANAEARVLDFTAFYYAPLAGTATEARDIGALLPQARVWTQGEATEAVLKAVNRPRILHIATHGFFLPDQPQAAPKDPGVASNAAAPGPQQENPMLRSGLILAGVNQKQSGLGEDGVLTAQEAAGLNLFGTKLVVLSACETGLGDVQNGAGVYGLRRALALAGSETQVMSLWQVSDAATRDLMIAYYTRLQSGAGRISAMRQVQLAMLRGTVLAKSGDIQRNLGLAASPAPGTPPAQGRQIGLGASDITPKTAWRHPYYWAAFIPSGAWTTMEGREPK